MGEKISGHLIILLALVFLSSCAGLPQVNYDALQSNDPASLPNHFAYLKNAEENESGRLFSPGNQVQLLRDGNQAYPAMLSAIHGAKTRIDIESFLFDQKVGGQFADALLERSLHGVEVNLIYDSYGSDQTPADIFDKLRNGGVQTIEYNPLDPTSVLDNSINNRDHRKLLVVDNRLAFTGGINISAVYKIRHRKISSMNGGDFDPAHVAWRDTQVRILGPAVPTFDELFVETWRDQQGPPLEAMRPPVSGGNQKDNQSGVEAGDLVQVIDGYPTKGRFTIYESLILAITLSQHSVHMATAYFVPPPDLLRALKEAARRGVDVVLLLPGVSDSDMAIKAGRASYSDLMDAGVKIYERQGDILHEKVAVIDGIWSTVGSSNLDWRSAALNNECNAVIMGERFGDQMEAMFQKDLQQAMPIDRQKWGDRPLLEILDERKALLMGEFL